MNKRTTLYHKIFGLLGLSFVIIVHEFGHFLAAKFFGVGVPIFSIGFGPRLFGYQFGNTVFQLAAIPLGGYVSMNPTELAMQPYSHKMVIILAGIFFNILFTYFILVYLAWRDNYQILPIINTIIPHSPAERANLQQNDTIVFVDGEPVDDDMSLLLEKIVSSPDETIIFTVERNNKTQLIPITVGTEHPTLGNGAGWLGIKWKRTLIKTTLLQAIMLGFQKIVLMFSNIGQFTAALFRKKEGPQITGPIGIMSVAAKSLAISPLYFLFVLSVISVNVAIFNLLPIPFLDGGQAVRYTVEEIFGPIPESILHYLTLFFLLLFFLFIIFITMKDVSRLRNKR